MIPGSWSRATAVTLAILILGAIGWLLRGAKRGATRRSDVLPAPSPACSRNGTEAVPQ